MRAMRPDKLTLAALEATLRLYRDGRAREVPVWAMLAAPAEALRLRAEQLARLLGQPTAAAVTVVSSTSTVGGGAMPTAELPSWAVALRPHAPLGAGAIEARLRAAALPVLGRVVDGHVLLDVRTVPDADLERAGQAVRGVLGS